ncbi:murein biosynthesis integral membrane protein MurJ [Cellulomonas sp. HZM]|uniref:murein biosynthesis integral membrane protein MurJ n=1 Tax=Cellulomonas sp. HZM TaxID=1454010 RepID=UPI000A80F195|nr:murein biosynthesis integral membrane protein MurJ [Cellulomonas sp. HZM]
MTSAGATPADGPGPGPDAGTDAVPAPGSARRGAALMASGTAVSRGLGLLRQMVLISAIGATGQVADAFSVANKLPNVLYMLLAGGVLNAVLVPQVVRAYRRKVGQEYVDRLLSFGFAVLLAATVVLTAASPLLVRLYADPCSPAQQGLATTFAFWCVPQMFFYGVYALLGQVLNARGSFGPYMWAPVVNNVVSIAGFGAFIAIFSVAGADGRTAATWTGGETLLLAGSATLGVIAQALVLFPALRATGVHYRFRWGIRGSGLGRAGGVATWTLIGLAIGQLGYVVVSRVASAAPGAAGVAGGACAPDGPVAGNAAYDSAFLIFMLPHSLVTVSLATALFTRLAHQAHENDVDGVRGTLSVGLRVVGLFTVLATAVLMVLAVPATNIVLWSSTSGQVEAVAAVVLAMAVGLPAFGAWSMCQRVYYAYEDARGMVPIQVVMAVVVVVGTLLGRAVLAPTSWVVGAGLSMSASYLVGAVLGMWHLRSRLRTVDGPRVVRTHVQALVAGAVAGVVGIVVLAVIRSLLPPANLTSLVECAVVAPVMCLVFVVMLRLSRVSELGLLIDPVLARVRRRRGAAPSSLGAGRADGSVTVDEVVGRGTVLSGRYRVLEPAPSDLPGSSSWRATDQILDRVVRVRVLSSGHISQALDGARRAALVTDARLVRVLDVGTHEGHGYVVTENVAGPSLADLLASGPLTADQARAVVGEAAAALEVARRRGVHHLALRPSAVHVTDDGRVVVSGLGLDAGLLGTVARDAHTTTRADTVGLVRVLYAALTGRWPADDALAQIVGLPAAPTDGDALVGPADVVADVPADLDTLCVVTLGPHEDGPHSPGELVRELEPWGAIRAVPSSVPTPVVIAPGLAANLSADDDHVDPDAFDVDDMEDTAPIAVQRESIRTTFETQPPPAGVNLPGTPPPAAPTRTSAFGARAAGTAAAAGAGAGAVSASLPPTAPAAAPSPASSPAPSPEPGPFPTDEAVPPTAVTPAAASTASSTPAVPSGPESFSFDQLVEEQDVRTTPERRFNPTALVLVLVGIAVVIGVVLAFKALFSSLDTGAPQARPVPTATSTAPKPTSTDESPSPDESESAPAETGAPPVIASATTVDPSDDDGEHQEAVKRAFDGDPSTYWYTMTYKRADFAGFKDGVGYVMKLKEPTKVSTVTLHANGTGGKVEIRDSSAKDPSGGTLLASGEFGSSVTYTLDPATTTGTLTLWITELPTAADGTFRLELSEIELS